MHAIVDQLSAHGVFVDASSLRKQAVSYLQNHPELMDQNFLSRSKYPHIDSYLNQQSVSGHWVDEIMLRAMAFCIGRDIHILHDNGYTCILQQPLQTRERIFLWLIDEEHYVSLHFQSGSVNCKTSEPVECENKEIQIQD